MTNHENLTHCEQLVMKTIWDADEELSLMDVVQHVNSKYHKNWKPQTVSTFLSRLVGHYRQGRVFNYQILVPLEEYKGQLTSDFVDFWYHGNAYEFLYTLMKEKQKDLLARTQKIFDPSRLEKAVALIEKANQLPGK